MMVNPDILKWARNRQGLTITEVAKQLKQPEKVVFDWESGAQCPSYAKLEQLAYRVYKCPLAVFFFPTPPAEESLKEQFRTIPDQELDKLSSDTRYKLRQARLFQLGLSELLSESGTNRSSKFRTLRLEISEEPESAAVRLRNLLEIDIQVQMSWKGVDLALKNWREAIERIGVYVFKESFKQSTVSGFCLVDDALPIIYVNNSHTKSRQIFTVIHELVHVLLGIASIDLQGSSNRFKSGALYNEVEIFCNKVTSLVLVPRVEFERALSELHTKVDESQISKIARSFSVSREVIARILLDQQIISQQSYEVWSKKWIREALDERRRKKSGGNYYSTLLTYLSPSLSKLVFSYQSSNRLSVDQASEFLNISPDKFDKLQAKYFDAMASK